MKKNMYTEQINQIKATEAAKQAIKEKMLQKMDQEETSDYVGRGKEERRKENLRGRLRFFIPKNGRIAFALFAVVLLALFGGTVLLQNQNRIPLENSLGSVKVRYVKKAPQISTQYDLAYFTEEELITRKGLEIVQGTITELRNIEVSIEGHKDYYALASVEIEKVLKGQCKVGDTIVIKLPCPIGSDIWIEDTEVASAMRVGMKGIFMPIAYDEENSYYQEGNTTLYWKDFVDFGLLDGERYAFLETEKGLLYADFAYPSLGGANTITEVEEFILKMLEAKSE